jgi:hypothetical protein
MRRSWLLVALFVLTVALAGGMPVVAQRPRSDKAANAEPGADEKERIEAALTLTREAAQQYKIVRKGSDEAPAYLRSEPVLRWSNPAVGEIHGNVFLWTAPDPNRTNQAKDDRSPAGRPVAVGSLFKWFSPHTHSSHEFQSLSETPLSAAYDGRTVWTTKESGVTFLPLAEAGVPAATPARRLNQMRDLAKRFGGHMTTRQGDERELRLLPQPIYRYDEADGPLVAGGIFAFVEGTDPEILLLLEVRGDDSPRWHFAGARMQNVALSLAFDGRQVWDVAELEWSVAFDHTQPYTLFDTPGK